MRHKIKTEIPELLRQDVSAQLLAATSKNALFDRNDLGYQISHRRVGVHVLIGNPHGIITDRYYPPSKYGYETFQALRKDLVELFEKDPAYEGLSRNFDGLIDDMDEYFYFDPRGYTLNNVYKKEEASEVDETEEEART